MPLPRLSGGGAAVLAPGIITVPIDGTDGLMIKFQQLSTGRALEIQDYQGAPIAAVSPVGGIAVFGDMLRAGRNVTGFEFIHLDGRTSPPSLGFPPTNAPHRIWAGVGTPQATITFGTPAVNDLYYNFQNSLWYICTAASGTPGTWVTYTQLGKLLLAPPPSGDTTGATDTAALASIAADGYTVMLWPQNNGAYYVTKLPDVTPRRALWGFGALVFDVGSSGACLTIRNPVWPTLNDPTGLALNVFGADNQSSQVGGFVIDGRNHTGTAKTGLEAGDMYQVVASKITVSNYTAAGDKGIVFLNRTGYMERSHWEDIAVNNCTNGYVWDHVSPGTASFDFSTFKLTGRFYANQNAYTFQGGVQAFEGCNFQLGGNFYGAATNTGIALSIGTDSSNVILRDVQLNLHFQSNGSGAVGHQTINKGSSSFVRAYGVLKCFYGTPVWQASNVTFPSSSFSYAGLIDVDVNLGRKQAGEAWNMLGGTTGVRGLSSVAGGNATLTVASGDAFAFTAANGANVLKLTGTYTGKSRRLTLEIKQPVSGAAATIDWTAPGTNLTGNNAAGSAQTITFPGGTPSLSTVNGATDVVTLFTSNGLNWYGFKLDSLAKSTQWVYARWMQPTGNSSAGANSAQGKGSIRSTIAAANTSGATFDLMLDPAVTSYDLYLLWSAGDATVGNVMFQLMTLSGDTVTAYVTAGTTAGSAGTNWTYWGNPTFATPGAANKTTLSKINTVGPVTGWQTGQLWQTIYVAIIDGTGGPASPYAAGKLIDIHGVQLIPL